MLSILPILGLPFAWLSLTSIFIVASPYFLHPSAECVHTSTTWLSMLCFPLPNLLILSLLSLSLSVTSMVRLNILISVVSKSLSSLLLSINTSVPHSSTGLMFLYILTFSFLAIVLPHITPLSSLQSFRVIHHTVTNVQLQRCFTSEALIRWFDICVYDEDVPEKSIVVASSLLNYLFTRAEPVPMCICPLAEPVPVCIYPFNGYWSFEYKS